MPKRSLTLVKAESLPGDPGGSPALFTYRGTHAGDTYFDFTITVRHWAHRVDGTMFSLKSIDLGNVEAVTAEELFASVCRQLKRAAKALDITGATAALPLKFEYEGEDNGDGESAEGEVHGPNGLRQSLSE